MAEADCDLCAALGYRSCDRCGNPVFPEALEMCSVLGLSEELCGYCVSDVEASRSSDAARGI